MKLLSGLEIIHIYPEEPLKFLLSNLQEILLLLLNFRLSGLLPGFLPKVLCLGHRSFQRCPSLVFKNNFHTCKSLSFLQSVMRLSA